MVSVNYHKLLFLETDVTEKITNENEITDLEKSVEVCSATSTNNFDEKCAIIDNTIVTARTEVFLIDNIDNNDIILNPDLPPNHFARFSDDISTWPPIILESFREYFTLNTPKQNIDCIHHSKKTIRGVLRKLTKEHFYLIKKSGHEIHRSWLIYSPSAVSLFCYICKLYSPNNTLLCKEGFNDWQHTKE